MPLTMLSPAAEKIVPPTGQQALLLVTTSTGLGLRQGWQSIKLPRGGIPPPPWDAGEEAGDGGAVDLAAGHGRESPSVAGGRPVLIAYQQRDQAERLQRQRGLGGGSGGYGKAPFLLPNPVRGARLEAHQPRPDPVPDCPAGAVQ